MGARGWLGWLMAALAAATLVIVVVDFVLLQNNRALQAEVNQRQQFINQSIQLGRVNEALIRTIATAVVTAKDDKLRDMLAQNGITINPPAAAAAPAGTAAPPPAKKGP
ncbi:MAG TPA: hypothetical protein VKY65_21410 [Alphaproteobacteria bacterium]|nr:hypothetical protein [Alphaproteobacteria bacterium]